MFRIFCKGIKNILYPHILFLILSAVLLLIPTPLEFLKGQSFIKKDDFLTIEQTPFVFIPEPGLQVKFIYNVYLFEFIKSNFMNWQKFKD